MASGTRFVFLDPSGKRARVVLTVMVIAAVLLAAITMAVVVGVLTAPDWSDAGVAPARAPLIETVAVGDTSERMVGTGLAARQGQSYLSRYAFMQPTIQSSWRALDLHGRHIDTLFLSAVDVDPRAPSGSLREPIQSAAWRAEIARRMGDTPVIAVVGIRGDGIGLGTLLARADERRRLVADLRDLASERVFAGYLLDHRLLSDASPAVAARFVVELRAALASDDRKVYVRVGEEHLETAVGDAARFADRVVVDIHHGSGDGPPASQARVEDAIRLALRRVPAERLVFVLGAFARRARADGIVEHRPVQYAWQVAHAADVPVGFDARALNAGFTIRHADGAVERYWLLDAVSGFNQARSARGAGLAGVAVDQLGFEDPGLWSILDPEGDDEHKLAALSAPSAGLGGLDAHDGAVVSFRPGRNGRREVVFDERRGLIVDVRMPQPPLQIEATTLAPRGDRLVALTFDDGPDPRHTPRILDILAALDVRATFYVVGAQVVAHPAIVRRIVAEGHDLGNHSFTHSNLTDAGRQRIAAELNATQRALEAATGVGSILFRPPFAGRGLAFLEASPTLVEVASELGYVFGSYDVDSIDFLVDADWIARRIVEDVKRQDHAIVLLHDGGGNRSATIEALPRIIDGLRREGYRFVTTHELVGVSRETLMPTAPGQSDAPLGPLRAIFVTVSGPLLSSLPVIAILVALIGICRLVAVLMLSRSRPAVDEAEARGTPRDVAVIVPAYNEEAGIVATVASLLASHTRGAIRVIVVDDGSSDATSAKVAQAFDDDERVVLVRKANGGKSSALNAGFEIATEDIVVAIDGDTVVEPDAIDRLIAPFADPKVAAVAGKVVVGAPRGLLAHFQALEYTIAQNVEREAFARLHAIAVVPGAFGAWRRSVVLAHGGYTTDTLAEDADLTWAIQIGGWRVATRNDALAYTEAPETLRDFLKQRFRWIFGNLQVATKHVRSRGERTTTKLILVLNVYIFQFLISLFAPVVDLMVLFALFGLLTGGLSSAAIGLVLLSFAIFQSLDIILAARALRIDGKRISISVFSLMILQRFCYRQLLYYVALKSLLAAARGRLVGWGKLARRGLFGRPAAPASR